MLALLVNVDKNPLFSLEDRVEITRKVFQEYPNVEVDTFDGLLVDYAKRRDISVIVRVRITDGLNEQKTEPRN